MQGGDDGVRKAILFAVGNTIVSDTLDAARDLCFGSGEDKQASFSFLGYQAAQHRCGRLGAKGKERGGKNGWTRG